LLFIFDEPTTGLHFHDVNKLLKAFRALQGLGHTLVVIEHQMDVAANADWIIDLGPEGGDRGGDLVYEGPVEGLLRVDASATAPFLAQKLA
jgi:excinuclease ABC subunit A